MQFSLKSFYRKAYISKNIIRINSHFFLNKKTLSVYNISKPSSLISLNNYNNSRELFDFNVLKLNLAGSGFKDKIYQKLCPIIDFCITHKIKLEWDEDMGIYGNWSDYFLSIDQTIKFNNITLSNRKVKIFSPTWINNDTDFLLHILENYNSNYINEIYRFTPSTRSQIDKNIKGLNLKMFVCLLAFISGLLYRGFFIPAEHPTSSFLVFALTHVLLYMIVFHFFKARQLGPSLVFILISSLLVRLLFLGYPISDDVHRYAWEGKNLWQGYNPYENAPIYFNENLLKNKSMLKSKTR